MFTIHHQVNLHCTQHEKYGYTSEGPHTHICRCHSSSSFHALKKLGREEGSFTITSWRAPGAVFSTAHVLAKVLAVRQKEGIISVATTAN